MQDTDTDTTYYVYWLQIDTHQPFFYWLDVGDGRFVELPKCSRATLSQQKIKYLSPEQRKHYQVEIYSGKLFNEQSGELVHTGNSYNLDERWIFVMSPYGKLYDGKSEDVGTRERSNAKMKKSRA